MISVVCECANVYSPTQSRMWRCLAGSNGKYTKNEGKKQTIGFVEVRYFYSQISISKLSFYPEFCRRVEIIWRLRTIYFKADCAIIEVLKVTSPKHTNARNPNLNSKMLFSKQSPTGTGARTLIIQSFFPFHPPS